MHNHQMNADQIIKVPLQIYNMIDRDASAPPTMLDVKLGDVPSLQFINSLIIKIQSAK